jgi:antitoxin PrlF
MVLAVMREKGQITVPSEVRDQAGLEPGDPVEFELTNEGILMRPKKLIDASQAWFWTKEWQRGEREASRDIAEGRLSRVMDSEEFLNSLE